MAEVRGVSLAYRGVAAGTRIGRLALGGFLAFALVFGLQAGASALAAEEGSSTSASDLTAVGAGKREFVEHCARCHGEDAKGHGPAAEVARTHVPDLTTLSEANGGVFPYKAIYDTIDGRNVSRGHGDLEMPVWGERYTADRKDRIGELQAYARIFELITYLRSIQQRAAAE